MDIGFFEAFIILYVSLFAHEVGHWLVKKPVLFVVGRGPSISFMFRNVECRFCLFPLGGMCEYEEDRLGRLTYAGGPLANLALFLSFFLISVLTGSFFLFTVSIVNAILFLVVALPVRGSDGRKILLGD